MRRVLRLLVPGLLLLGAPAARGLECGPAAALLLTDPAAAESLRRGGRCAREPLPGGPLELAAAADENTLTVALVEEGPDGPRVVAGPVSTDVLTIDPIWSPLMRVVPSPLGPRSGTVALQLSNVYSSTGRATNTQALHLFRRRGEVLEPIFAAFTQASHSYTVPCGRRHRGDEPCRREWTFRRRVEVTLARPGALPDLLVRDLRTGRVVSRHRWGGTGYQPPVSDRTPSLGEG
ncbi:hypothetical protein [Muricoccus radiodurans]|uniref:hypothetical protein n=1 Tax=Muricoccus radiodurans TaxID=2231721 RepID=UPI003CECC3E1